MDASETTKIVLSRIESVDHDPESVRKIMAYILSEDQVEKMNWLASASDFHLRSYITHVKALIELHSLPTSPTPIYVGSAVTFNGSIPLFQGWPVSADGFLNYQQQRDELIPFMWYSPIMSANGRSGFMVFPRGEAVDSLHPLLRRSLPLNIEEGGGGNGYGSGNGFSRKPCMYYAKGFCKNGSNCKFLHVDGGGVAGFDEAFQQPSYNEIPFINRGDSSSRQIYLTFPADSTFREEDVCDYFKMFGPVQDVRIPYQEPRMFGFVLFDSAETVNNVLAKGNPHFVCDSKVLVKPYKEKTKVPEKKYQHLLDGDEYSSSSSHPLIDSREHFELPFGPRMILNRQDMQPRNHAHNHFLQGFPSTIPVLNRRAFMNQRVADLCDAITEYSQDFNDDSDESMTQFLPPNLFASPTKSVADNQSTLSK